MVWSAPERSNEKKSENKQPQPAFLRTDNHLSAYLKKFKVLLGDKTEEKRAVREVVQELTAVDLSLESIAIKNGTILVSVSPLEKGEIFMKKKEILQILESRGHHLIDFR